jgi:hypothetical protein
VVDVTLGPLNEIIRTEPHDFFAWEFLSYTYAVLGNAPSATNVDLDLITYFEFIPGAAPQVSRAMHRLQIWDPYGWQGRVAAKRAILVPFVPFEVVEHFVESVRTKIPRADRRRVHFAVERAITTRSECTEFIEVWESGPLTESVARHKLETSQICETAYIAIDVNGGVKVYQGAVS